VGHGLAVLVETRSHTLLYDAGAVYRSGFDTGREIVLPAMRANSWETLDRVVVSHADNDHAGGIPAVLESFPDAQVLMGPDVELPGGEICRTGQAWTWDEVRFEVLHPDPAIHRRGNDSSCVLKITTWAGSLLLTGDVEAAGERALMAHAESLASDIVVVPHHGSATSSSTALVSATAADHALVSAGYLNHWGFPKPQVAQRWQDAGAVMATTGDAGAVRVILEPGKPVQVQGQRARQRRYWN
ncbi:MAG: MBL fold metallo-hydrolase, partial [Bryobacterales bacterium]|nr:MBL fold metallo-hydrolase [Bryobacterales bacterium]